MDGAACIAECAAFVGPIVGAVVGPIVIAASCLWWNLRIKREQFEQTSEVRKSEDVVTDSSADVQARSRLPSLESDSGVDDADADVEAKVDEIATASSTAESFMPEPETPPRWRKPSTAETEPAGGSLEREERDAIHPVSSNPKKLTMLALQEVAGPEVSVTTVKSVRKVADALQWDLHVLNS